MTDRSARQNINPMHLITLTHVRNGRDGKQGTVQVSAYMPENFKLNFGTRWGKNFVARAAEAAMAQVNRVVSPLTGGALASQMTTLLSYEGTDSPALDVVLQFNTEGDTEKDVLEPIQLLIGMCLPELTSNISISIPGPNAQDFIRNRLGGAGSVAGNDGSVRTMNETIVLQIGTYLTIQPVVVSGIGIDFGNVLDDLGNPMSANVSLRIQPFMAPYRQDIENWMKRASA